MGYCWLIEQSDYFKRLFDLAGSHHSWRTSSHLLFWWEIGCPRQLKQRLLYVPVLSKALRFWSKSLVAGVILDSLSPKPPLVFPGSQAKYFVFHLCDPFWAAQLSFQIQQSIPETKDLTYMQILGCQHLLFRLAVSTRQSTFSFPSFYGFCVQQTVGFSWWEFCIIFPFPRIQFWDLTLIASNLDFHLQGLGPNHHYPFWLTPLKPLLSRSGKEICLRIRRSCRFSTVIKVYSQKIAILDL